MMQWLVACKFYNSHPIWLLFLEKLFIIDINAIGHFEFNPSKIASGLSDLVLDLSQIAFVTDANQADVYKIKDSSSVLREGAVSLSKKKSEGGGGGPSPPPFSQKLVKIFLNTTTFEISPPLLKSSDRAWLQLS